MEILIEDKTAQASIFANEPLFEVHVALYSRKLFGLVSIFSDLGVLLKGKKKSTSGIDFGAHQAVLVVNEESRETLPEELQQGIVLTIYESKGLEFDDILLYNFFKDSQVCIS